MAEQITGMPIPSDSISPARVAFDLMSRIAQAEHIGKTIEHPRTYYLALYRECAEAVRHTGELQGLDLHFVSAEDTKA